MATKLGCVILSCKILVKKDSFLLSFFSFILTLF
nr:MAG TPA: hypothetical protein [Caudoviricetes sp.]